MFGFEIDFLKNIEQIRTEGLNKLFELITMMGEEMLMILLILVIWFAFDKRTAQRMFFITAVSGCANSVVKCLCKVPRPFTRGVACVRPDTATGYSFPSGHTQNFSSISTVVAILLKKVWVWIVVSILILLVAFSRMYLGAHYPSDVIVGAVAGVLFAFGGNLLYDRVENKNKLYLYATLAFLPFMVYFMFDSDPLLNDSFKAFGLIAGLAAAASFEERFAPITYDVPWWKKTLRVLIGLVLALAVKEGLKALDVFNVVQITFLLSAVRYFLMVFVVAGLFPLLMKKIKL